MMHPQHHSPTLSPESAGRLYSLYPSSSVMNGASPSECARLLSSTPTKMAQLPRVQGGSEPSAAVMRPRAATVTTGGMNEVTGLLRTTGAIPLSTPTTTGSNSAPGVTPLKKSSRRNPWGPETYSDLITVAIHSYPDQQATLQQIYDFIIANYEYFRERSDPTSSAGWKNSIRHNLSLHDRFTKCPKSTDNIKSSYWRINTEVASKPYVRRRACSIDNANLKRSGQHHQHHSSTGGGRPGSGHNRSTAAGSAVSNGLGGNGGAHKRDAKPPPPQCAPASNRSPPLPMLCEIPSQTTSTHPLNLQLPSDNSLTVASSYLNFSSPASNTGVCRSGAVTGLDERVTLLGHNMMILGGGSDSTSAGGSVCWPSLPSPKSVALDGCNTGPYHYLQQPHHHQQQQHPQQQQQQQQHELVPGTPFGSFRFPSSFGSGSTDQSFRSRTSGLIEQLLRVDDSQSPLLHPSSSDQTGGSVSSAYLLADNGLGPANAPPYFPNSLLVNTSMPSAGASDRRQSHHHDNLHHQLQHYEHSRQQHLPMHIDTAQAVRGNGASTGETAGSPSPIALLKHHISHQHQPQQQQPQQHRIARSPNASIVHHHPGHHGHHIHQHLRPVSLHVGANEASGLGQCSPLTGFPSAVSSASTLPWPSGGANGCGAAVYQASGDPDQPSLVNSSVSDGQRQYSQTAQEVGQAWSATSAASFMPNCASESNSGDPFATINLLPRDSSSNYPAACEAAASSVLQSRNKILPSSGLCTSLAMSLSPNTMTYYSRGLSAFTPSVVEYSSPYQVKVRSKTQESLQHHILKVEDNGDDGGCGAGAGNSSDLSPLSSTDAPRFCRPTPEPFQQHKHMFQPSDRSCFTSYPSRMSAEDGELAFSSGEHRHQSLRAMRNTAEVGFFDSDEAVKGDGASEQTRDGRSLEMNTDEDGVEDCESLELQLSLELADRIVGSSGIGR